MIRSVFVVALLALIALPLRAQTSSPDAAGKRAVAVRVEGEAPRLDGRLDDAIWRKARPIADFIQKDPVEGAEPSERTEVAFAYDDDALYVGARMYSVDPSAIQAIVTRRDNSGPSERIIIALDTYHDRRTAYSFSITAAGVRTDYYHPSDGEYDREYSFDPVWEGRAVIDSAGWSAEMRIPFSQLRFNDLEHQIWGLNIDRYIPTKNEDIYWIPIPKEGTGWASHFGELAGLDGIASSRRIELLPYAASGARFTSLHDPDDPFNDGRNLSARAGLDMKMGIGSNLTLDATVNPDFGQVEADPAEVNLSAFETFFSERRPFFIEGSQLLEGAGPEYFYSRRIGAAPHGDADGDFVDIPNNSTILGAAKLTGRLPSGLSVGALTAVTRREHARIFNLDSRTFNEQQVEPVDGYGVARVQQEFGPAASTVGGMITAVRRDLDSNDPLSAILARQAVTGGADWNLRFDGGEYELEGYVGGSYVAGEPDAMVRIQRSSAHYFQRPDADYLGVDSSARSLAGYTAGLSLEREGGENWLWTINTSVKSPGFDLNDAGSLSSADELNTYASLTYRETEPGAIFHNYSISTSAESGWNFGGMNRYVNYSLSGNTTFKNYWGMNLSTTFSPRVESDDYTRGGPRIAMPASLYLSGSLYNNFSDNVRWNIGSNGSAVEIGSWSFGVDAGVSANLGDRLEVSVNPSYSRSLVVRQYVATAPNGRAETYGKRYIFGALDQTTIAAQLRVSYAITPDLSLEGYAEPFVASGRYDRFGELAAPGALDLRYYGTDGTSIGNLPNGDYVIFDGAAAQSFPNPNFNAMFFRSNLVLRWEWRPGSTIFLVWQQDRSGFDGRGRPARASDLWKSVTADGDHFLTLKASYWLPID
jgi:hypothetical protein